MPTVSELHHMLDQSGAEEAGSTVKNGVDTVGNMDVNQLGGVQTYIDPIPPELYHVLDESATEVGSTVKNGVDTVGNMDVNQLGGVQTYIDPILLEANFY